MKLPVILINLSKPISDIPMANIFQKTLLVISAVLVSSLVCAQKVSDLQGVWYNENTVFYFDGQKCEYVMFGGDFTDFSLKGNILSIKEKPYYIEKDGVLARREGQYVFDFAILKLTKDSLVMKALAKTL
jgi:hypothetical protein